MNSNAHSFVCPAIVKAAQDPKTQQEAVDFFKDEYECDRFIAHMKKPIVTFMDGITSGFENRTFPDHRKTHAG